MEKLIFCACILKKSVFCCFPSSPIGLVNYNESKSECAYIAKCKCKHATERLKSAARL